MNPDVDWFFSKPTKWQQEYELLRTIVLQCKLNEELKWGCPCYTYDGRNVVLVHGFKDYCALLFMKGVLLSDSKKILVQQTPNVQAARQLRFKGLAEIKNLKATIVEYVKEAIQVEKQGLTAPLKNTEEYEMPHEFGTLLTEMPELKAAFEKLTPGRQRGYLLYFTSAKQAKTRESRIEKCVDKILEGKGLDD